MEATNCCEVTSYIVQILDEVLRREKPLGDNILKININVYKRKVNNQLIIIKHVENMVNVGPRYSAGKLFHSCLHLCPFSEIFSPHKNVLVPDLVRVLRFDRFSTILVISELVWYFIVAENSHELEQC